MHGTWLRKLELTRVHAIYYTRSQEEKAAFLSSFTTFLKGSIKKLELAIQSLLKN